ncbi:LacI family DNA-binding transcriptional regulator [Rathayibacter sp. SD072]|uniref:LacI family DNA-binding transcriptional regulator n=1 Tax=Rathayibacter sp. SD072 TaxID=2781731 RepID=UPI001A97BCC6|nr:LacI family DNA-binding transcriptional regulator [Rathayibacter sp. SD072]MBO0982628.1 LacI family DNA-binding transcriptional regulator [Rathayibacter sp. SD072]
MTGTPAEGDGGLRRRRASGGRATIKDVALHAGVSTAAVSKVLRHAHGVSESMRLRVEESMAALAYRPLTSARGMRGKTFTIGMLVPDFANPFVSQLIDGITRRTEAAGYDLLVGPLGSSRSSEAHTIDMLRDRQMDGLLLDSPLGSEEYLSVVGRLVPTVVVGRHGPAAHYDTVASDDIAGSRLIIEHLVGLGHSRIAYLCHSESLTTDPRLPQNVRTEGYRKAMRALGLGDALDIIPTAWNHEGGRAGARQLLTRAVMPTALHAGADVAAFGALSELWLANRRVPADLSVVGYDNTETASMEPIGLTSVDQFGERIGAFAAELLLERIGGRHHPRHVLIEPELIARRTSAPPTV